MKRSIYFPTLEKCRKNSYNSLWNKEFTKHKDRKNIRTKCRNTLNPTRFQKKGKFRKMPLKKCRKNIGNKTMRLELMFSFLQNSLKELQEFKGIVGKHSCSKGNYRNFFYIFPMQENKCYISCVPYLVTNKKTGHTSVRFLTRQLIVKSRDHQFLTDPLRSRGMAS